jgi:hypothetical protein
MRHSSPPSFRTFRHWLPVGVALGSMFFFLPAAVEAQSGRGRGGDASSRGGSEPSGSGGRPSGGDGRSWQGRGESPAGGGGRGMGGGGPMGGGMMMMGGGGGFDPSAILERMDANGNGMIDPEEAQGPARFFLERMARNNPDLDLSRPIPIRQLTAEFERMRSGGGAPGGGWGGSREEEEPGVPGGPKTLVPTFGRPNQAAQLPGFGPQAAMFTTPVEPEDLKSAEEIIQRLDRNRDGLLNQDEVRRGRWRDDPMLFDRNGDGNLSLQELAIRAARIRVTRSDDRSGNDRRGRRDEPRGTAGKESASSLLSTAAEIWQNRASFVPTAPRSGSRAARPATDGLPRGFLTLDSNGDNQVSMAEFSSQWDEQVLEQFQRFDLNRDGVITVEECLEAIRRGEVWGGSGGGGSGSARSSSRADEANPSTAAGGSSGGGNATDANLTLPEGYTDVDESWIAYTQNKFKRADKNQDGALTPDEWRASQGPFSEVDTDGDGRVSFQEFFVREYSKRDSR